MSQTKAQLVEGLNINTSAPANSLVVDSSGRVGIGITAPNVALTVGGGAVSAGAQIPNSDIGLPAAYANGFFRAVGNYNQGAGVGGTLQLGGKSYTDSGFIGAFLISAVSGGNATDALTFSTQTSFSNVVSEKMRLDTSGRLLVGTSSARGNFSGTDTPQFQVEGTTFNTATISVTSASSLGGGNIELAGTGTGTVGNTGTVSNNGYLGSIHFLGGDGTNLRKGAAIDCQVDGTPGANDMPGRLVFSTTADGASSPTERMRITNNGDTAVISPGNVFCAESTAGAGTTFRALFAGHSSTGYGTRTISFQVWNNGNVQNTNNSYGAISDLKLKENIVDAGSQWDDIKALRVRNYNFKPETNQQTHTQIGLVAQETELVSPGLVTESPDIDFEGNETGEVTKSVNYSVLYMKAVKALQEAMERIETLEAKVAALEDV
jgi:hypothetical protein